ncbi:MAG TPA: hypothetical protein VN372_00075 [Methanospirillum sp.]|nr:hypothetical protein [Methanospirillum sp.]
MTLEFYSKILAIICVLIGGSAGIMLMACLIVPTDAAFSGDEYLISTGGIHINNEHQWVDGDSLWPVFGGDGYYHEGSAAQQGVTGPGNSEYSSLTSLGPEFRQTSGLIATGGMAVWDTLYSGTTQPNESELICSAGDLGVSGDVSATGSTPLDQWEVVMTGAQGPNGRYQSDKFNSGEDFALNARFEGRGMFNGDLLAEASSGLDKDSNTLNFDTHMHRTVFGASNMTGGIRGSVDWSFSDFSDPFNQTANQTANVTTTDEVANATEEA